MLMLDLVFRVTRAEAIVAHMGDTNYSVTQPSGVSTIGGPYGIDAALSK